MGQRTTVTAMAHRRESDDLLDAGGATHGSGHGPRAKRRNGLGQALATPVLLASALAMALAAGWGTGSAAMADTRQDCQRWLTSHGDLHHSIGNRLGAAHLLTKASKLDENDPAHPHSLYRESDLQRLCRDT